MLTVISPAKTLDFETPPRTRRATRPRFLERSAQLVEDARALSPGEIRELMGVSEHIAALNHGRFRDWQLPFSLDNARQALFAFRGEVYNGLDADSLDGGQLGYAQQHLRILSGLYGILRPLDLIQPYRLEMGLKFPNRGGGNLYQFWGESITGELNRELRKAGSQVLVNLASGEYFQAIRPRALNAGIVTPVFRDLKGGKYKVISFFAKKARGQMARFIIDRQLEDPRGLEEFRADGYRFNAAASADGELVFTRDTSPAAA
jgi:cytoplasmic iron level regulating protein YaaA (DUF328/UPF0246 family)